jgi:putative colanic acid biosynthesis glycosyltransferase WcaI
VKLLAYHSFYRPDQIGVGKYAFEMSEWFAEREHCVRVICPPPYYPYWRVQVPYSGWRYHFEVLQGVRVLRAPVWMPKEPKGLPRLLFNCSFAVSSFPLLFVELMRRPDMLFVTQPSFVNALVAVIVARCLRIRTWLHVQDFDLDIAFSMGQLRSSFLRRTAARLEHWVLGHFDVVSTISAGMAARLNIKGVCQDRTRLIPNWVDTRVVFPLGRPSAYRAELGIADGDIVALFAGNLGRKQSVETLIHAASRLANIGYIRIVICGNGPHENHLKDLAKDLWNVSFLPLQPSERINELLNLGDVHVLTQEGEVADLVMPSKLIGMLASGRPIVATAEKESSVGAIVSSCGQLVPARDSEELASSILRLAGDPDRRRVLGGRARKFAVERLDKNKVLSTLESCIHDAIHPAFV